MPSAWKEIERCMLHQPKLSDGADLDTHWFEAEDSKPPGARDHTFALWTADYMIENDGGGRRLQIPLITIKEV
jgi:hypothetical protein